MGKCLLKSYEDFYNMMFERGYWNNKDYSIEKAKASMEYHENGMIFPCVAVHNWITNYRGREVPDIEFVNLKEDFGLDYCQDCGMLVENVDYGNSKVDGDWKSICDACTDG